MKENKDINNTKKIISNVIMAVEIVIIIACIVISILSIQNSQLKNKGLIKGTNLTVVLSDSMEGNVTDYKVKSFNAGDLLIIKSINEDKVQDLKVGDVVTYTTIVRVDGKQQYSLVSHRIVDIQYDNDGKIETIGTLGDKAQLFGVPDYFLPSDIKGVVKNVVPKVGKILLWFQQSTNFLLVVVIPLALLLIYNLYIFIKQVMSAKLIKVEEKNKQDIEDMKQALKEELLGSVKNSNNEATIDEEEIKRKAIEEYLASIKDKETKENSEDQ